MRTGLLVSLGLTSLALFIATGCSHDAGTVGGTPGSAGSSGCSPGTEACPCAANKSCQAGLTCASNLCVNLGGNGGTTGGAGGTTAGVGGATGGAGGTIPGSGGSTGGTSSGAGGTTGGAGGTTGGAGGTTAGAGGTTGGAGGPTGGAGGSPGQGGSGGGNLLLLPDSSGAVVNPGAAILGSWYASTDSTPKSTGLGACVRNGASICSVFAAGSPAQGGAFGPTDSPITVGKMCASGTVAQVVADPTTGSSLDYSGIWGAVIGLGLNGTAFGTTGSTSNAYDATARGIVGISFDIDVVPYANGALSFRVEFPTAAVPGTTDIDAAYWDGATSNGSPVTAGQNVILWSNVLGPMYETAAPPFDPSQLLAVQFHVIGSPVGPVPFNFCISNLTALTSP